MNLRLFKKNVFDVFIVFMSENDIKDEMNYVTLACSSCLYWLFISPFCKLAISRKGHAFIHGHLQALPFVHSDPELQNLAHRYPCKCYFIG